MPLIKALDEKQLVHGCLRQDRRCQKMLFEKYFSDMMSVCVRYARDDDDAKDILQNSFIKVFAKFDLYNGQGALKSWIQSIVIRTAIDHYRRRQRENKVIVAEPEDWESGTEAEIETDMAAEEILKMVQLLPNMQRAVFNLFAVEGFSHKEIADELDITEGTSKWYLCEARKSLKTMISLVYTQKIKEYAA